jgi:HAD superfamily hydrolase (TIGR01509 family)
MSQNYAETIETFLQRHNYPEFSPRAVLFDMDGVLYNSMPNHARAWVRSMRESGLNMTEADAYRFEGMRGVETIKIIARQQWGRTISDNESQTIYDLKSRYYAEQPKADKIEGVVELMQQLKLMGLQIAVVTGSGQHSLLDKLEEEFPGLVSRQLMVTSFDVKQGKPKPDPYLKGMRKCHVKPWQTIVVENAPLGVRAGVAAGCFTIAVNTGPLPRTELEQEGASLVFDRMTDLNEQLQTILHSITENNLGTLLRETSWHLNYHEVMQFIGDNKKKPSKHFDDEDSMFYWIKYNKRLMQRGKLPTERKERMEKLLEALAQYKRFNSYTYVNAELNPTK